MRLLFCTLLLSLTLLAGCLPTKGKPPASPAPTANAESSKPPGAVSPYWHGEGGPVTPDEALAYYAALKTLKSDELRHEHERLKTAVAAPEGRLARLQLLLLATLPGQTLIEPAEAIKALEQTRQDAEFHRDLADLLILLDDQLSSRRSVQGHGKEEGQKFRAVRKRLKAKEDELESCQAREEELADTLRKLQEIERGLHDRERKK